MVADDWLSVLNHLWQSTRYAPMISRDITVFDYASLLFLNNDFLKSKVCEYCCRSTILFKYWKLTNARRRWCIAGPTQYLLIVSLAVLYTCRDPPPGIAERAVLPLTKYSGKMNVARQLGSWKSVQFWNEVRRVISCGYFSYWSQVLPFAMVY